MQVLVLTLLLTPATVWAAPGPQRSSDNLDPETVEVVQNAVERVGQRYRPTVLPAQSGIDDEASGSAESLPVVGMTEHSASGITLTTPENWEVAEVGFGTVFNISDPNTGFLGMVEDSGNADEFPGIIALLLFEEQADIIVREIDENGTVLEINRLRTAQDLPLLEILFAANVEGVDMLGSLGLVSSGLNLYVLFGLAPEEQWPSVEDGVALMAETIRLDDELLTLTTAAEGDLRHTVASEEYSLTVPSGWQVGDTDDSDLSVVLVDPDVEHVGALGIQLEAGFLEGTDLEALLGATADEMGPETVDLLMPQIIEALDIGVGDFEIDDALSDIFPAEQGFSARFVGTADLDDLVMPVVFFVNLREDGFAGLIVFGDIDSTLETQNLYTGILDSVTWE
jgi:hypothetical protein